MKKFSALLLALTLSASVYAQALNSAVTFNVNGQTISGTVKSVGPNGQVTITNATGQSATLTPGTTPGTFTVSNSTIPGLASGGTVATAGTAAAAGVGAVSAGAIAGTVAFVAVVASTTNNNTNPASASASASN